MASATTTFKVIEEQADVKPRVSDVTVTPTSIRAGQRFNVGYKISNDGTTPMIGTTTISFQCPGNVCIRDTHGTTNMIQPKTSTTGRMTHTMPPNATKGTYTVTVTYTTKNLPGTPTHERTKPTTATTRATFS